MSQELQENRVCVQLELEEEKNYLNSSYFQRLQWEDIRKKFPYFLVFISTIQVILFYAFGEVLTLFFAVDPFRRHELWRYGTVVLVHQSEFHLWTNVILQLFGGVWMEIANGTKISFFIYIAAAFSGSLFYLAVAPREYLVGASAGTYGNVLANCILLGLNWRETKNCWIRLPTFIAMAVLVIDNTLSFLEMIGIHQNSQNVAHAAHAGEAIVGILGVLATLELAPSAPWKQFARKCSRLTLSAVFVILFFFITFGSGYFPPAFNFHYDGTAYVHACYTMLYKNWSCYSRETCLLEQPCKDLQVVDLYLYNGTLVDLNPVLENELNQEYFE